MEWLWDGELPILIGRYDWFFVFLFVARFVGLTTLEFWFPARKLVYREVILNDLSAFSVYQFVVFPTALWFVQYIPIRPHLPEMVLGMPLPLRLFAYLVLADFGHYWIHRLMHTKHVWRVHKWHHAPTYMYWLMGVRATIPQQVLVNLPYVAAYAFLDLSPWWMAVAIAAGHVLQNDWMHLNVTWQSSWLEWLVVTPRYHHLHHSKNPAYHTANLAALFTVWDRLFGTYVDPEAVARELSFGLAEDPPSWRLIAGV